MKVIKQFFNLLSYVVYLIIIVVLLLVAPILLGNKPVMVLSGSMEPTYHVGSLIYYKAASFEEIQPGDAITFSAGEDSHVTHRVVEKNEADQTFVTKGDNNEDKDSNPVPYANVEGKASKITIPYAGFFINFIKRPPVIVALGGIILFSILLDYLFPDKPKDKDGEEERTEKNEKE